MTKLDDLMAERVRLDADIAAAKAEAVAGIHAWMAQVGVTLADLGPAPRTTSTRPVKYRDGAGNTWTGVGQRPRWLRAALLDGGSLEQYRFPR